MSRSQFEITYEYKNTTTKNVEIWFAKPMEMSTQSQIEIITNMEPDTITNEPIVNSIYYYDLKPDENLTVVFRYMGDGKSSNGRVELTTEERAYYLRSNMLISVNDDIKNHALSIVGDVTISDEEKAGRIYKFITKNYKYSTDFVDRGIESFMKRKKGDCGEFAALFCSFCRALNIPSRILYGTWTLTKFAPHTWSEIYIEGKGWIPVDPSLGRLKVYYHPLLAVTTAIYYGVLPNKDKYFGEHEGKRFAFSIEAERQLNPPYVNGAFLNTVEKNTIDGVEVAWGYEAIEGNAPFLQPIYPKIHSKEKKLPYRLLFGSWKGRYVKKSKQLSYKLKASCFLLAFLIFLFEIVNDIVFKYSAIDNIFSIGTACFILLGTALSFIRKEGNILIYILVFLFFLGQLNNIQKLI